MKNLTRSNVLALAAILLCAGRAPAQWEQSQIPQAEAIRLAARALQAPRAKTLDGEPVKIVIEETATTPIVRLSGALKLTKNETRGCGPLDCATYTVNRYTARLLSESGEAYLLDLDLFELADRVDGDGVVRSVDLSAEDGSSRYHWNCPDAGARITMACGYRPFTLDQLLAKGLYFEWTRPSASPVHYRVQVEASFRIGGVGSDL